jgi:hypothetical protein
MVAAARVSACEEQVCMSQGLGQLMQNTKSQPQKHTSHTSANYLDAWSTPVRANNGVEGGTKARHILITAPAKQHSAKDAARFE